MRTKKRNNYTLSAEAQKIVDKIGTYKKSRFVSKCIELVGNKPTIDYTVKTIVSDNQLCPHLWIAVSPPDKTSLDFTSDDIIQCKHCDMLAKDYYSKKP